MIHNKRRLLRILLQGLLEWWLLLEKFHFRFPWYRHLGTTIAGLAIDMPGTNFVLALSTATPIHSSTDAGPTRIRSRCHCGSLELLIDVWASRNPNVKKEETNDENEADNDSDDNDNENTTHRVHRDRAINCHCQGCRRYHTGAFASFLETDSSNIHVAKGRDKIGKYASDCKELGPVERWFCTDCSSKLLTLPVLQPQPHASKSSSSLEEKTDANTSDAAGYATSCSDSGDQENGTIDQTRKPDLLLPATRTTTTTTTKCVCLLNLGPVVEDGISPDVTNSWKKELERPENNVHSDNQTSAVWACALPNYEDGYDYDDDDDDDEDDDEGCYDDEYYPKALPTPLKWSGGCACGACRYEFDLTHPTELQHCYCHLCRELSGSPFMTWIPVEKQDFRWTVRGTGGGEIETPASSSLSSSSSSPLQFVRTTPFGSRHICRNCQSVMTIVYDEQPDHVWPCAGSLDDSALPRDTEEMGKCLSRVCHICCGYHPTWLRTRDDGMERMEEAC
uniref:CENP-V/GFA domain-containing protein n=1 Tax=Pseudo-nitzschia australis TaxID=44445 RepID=A0A6U9YP86_9STRA|mmetsp:Transcript_26012/g.57021  ORF Transcript_26012/g.57021 Transcript_26012/m.57021 type:complete len:507 (+) Transcript_26012:289-1809(+)